MLPRDWEMTGTSPYMSGTSHSSAPRKRLPAAIAAAAAKPFIMFDLPSGAYPK